MISMRCVRQQMQCLRHTGCRAWMQTFIEQNLLKPTKEMSHRQVVVSASVGLWGGIFPVPPCTMPATLLCVLVYSAGVPKVQRFSVPMTALAVVVNELSLPVDLLMMPCFITLGQRAYQCVSGRALEDLQARPVETLRSFSTAFGLGIMVWASATPLVLGKIRVFGALAGKL
eukprot:symbB.v1.2.028624.t1/scaffold3050.1/size64711/5